MSVKCIALGNRIMCDDGIAIKVVESIKEDLEKINIKVVIGEVDAEYTFSEIKDDDFLIIVDSTYFGITPGDITCVSIDKIKKIKNSSVLSHDQSLIDMLVLSDIKINGYFIGIEISKICFDTNLSTDIRGKFTKIKSEVLGNILMVIKEEHYA